MDEQQNIIIYRTADGRASVALFAKDGKIWLNQQQMAELFATSKQAISYHVINILKEKELQENSVVKQYLTTAADGKNYNVAFYSLEMIIAVGYRVRGVRGTQFRQWATEHLTEYLVKGFTIDDELPLNPVFDFQALDAAEMQNVVCHHCKTGNFSGTANEEVIILYRCAQTLEPEFLLAESINRVSKRNNFHLADEIVDNAEVFILLLALVCAKAQFHHRHISNIALLTANLLKPLVDTIFITQGEYAYIGIQKKSLHNTNPFKFAFLELRMSSMISSAVLSSCQRPAKLFVHPLSLDGSDTELATELLNSAMSSSLTLLLRSFNSDQYFALTDEEGDNVIAFIMICLLFACKNRNNI